ncbi:uncharacterized protein LOC121731045 [Aricia agestis]|uniref:uncharacterized protein LOC121731045 n=1 Tax=Aricia agestis TaxID=91739 RepID=UPI001C209EB1|nr:uncharacterized protein LOC121731045 [Aricia agestis]
MCIRSICIVFMLLCGTFLIRCHRQIGPDPWDYESTTKNEFKDDTPPDLKAQAFKRASTMNNGYGDWFYRRLLAIVLKGGNVQKQEDGSVEILLQMRISQERWKIMEEYIVENSALSEDMFRRSIGYIEDSIYKPTVSEKIVMAWSEYIQFYLFEYKQYITWCLGCTAAVSLTIWLWKHISHKHVLILVFALLYLYEVFISYKEAEKEELNAFIKAVNTCKWQIWTSECEVPPPDLLVFLKHMNPLKIAIRMFSTLITEPMLTIHETVKIMVEGLTDGLLYPFNKIMYGIIVLIFSGMIMYLLISVMCNFILNIPFKLHLPFMKIFLSQRKRNLNNFNATPSRNDNGDRISGDTLRQLLDVLKDRQTNQLGTHQAITNGSEKNKKLKRLTKMGNQAMSSTSSLTKNLGSKLSKIKFRPSHNGSGDAGN